MTALIRPFLSICLMRIGPQDLPLSHTLLAVALGAHGLSAVTGWAIDLPFGQAIVAGLAQTVLLVALATSLLLAMRLRVRLVQTITALAGADALIGFIALPVFAFLPAGEGPADGSLASDLSALAVIVLVCWDVAVIGHVLRHALSVGFAIGLVLSVVFFWISLSVMQSVLGSGAAPGA